MIKCLHKRSFDYKYRGSQTLFSPLRCFKRQKLFDMSLSATVQLLTEAMVITGNIMPIKGICFMNEYASSSDYGTGERQSYHGSMP